MPDAQSGQSVPEATLTSAPPSSVVTIFIPPEVEHTICRSVGLTSGEATAAPMKSANHTSTKRVMNLALRSPCIFEIILAWGQVLSFAIFLWITLCAVLPTICGAHSLCRCKSRDTHRPQQWRGRDPRIFEKQDDQNHLGCEFVWQPLHRAVIRTQRFHRA